MWHGKANPVGRAARPGSNRLLLSGSVAVLSCATLAAAQSTPPPAKPHTHRAGHPASVTSPQPAAPVPVAPQQPKWPVNEAPQEPSVVWNSEGLQIRADNATLSQILDRVSTQTGAKIEGLSKDERVFGDYGPGNTREVLAQLLHGSGYDYLMLGDAGQGTPHTIILTVRPNTPASGQNQGVNNQPDQASDDDSNVVEPDNDDSEPQPPQVFQPPPQPPQPMNPQEPMTPQQRMQLMQQQRLQQMQQMQRQYQQQQQQQPQ